MGQKLTSIFDAIKKEGGLQMSMRLAMMTGMASQKAATEPDTPDMIKKFSDVYKELTGKNCPVK